MKKIKVNNLQVDERISTILLMKKQFQEQTLDINKFWEEF